MVPQQQAAVPGSSSGAWLSSPLLSIALVRWADPAQAAPEDLRGIGSSAPPALGSPLRVEQEPEQPTHVARGPGRGVLVVGLGDESRGDSGVGLHLVRWLAQMNWPAGVAFCQADETVPSKAERFARVVLVDAIEGCEAPGSLYHADPEELLACSAGGEGSGLGLLTMMPRTVRKRLTIFGVQPENTEFGSSLSRAVLASVPVLLPYLRTFILRASTELLHVN